MKKHFLLFFGLIAMVFASCDLIDDATTVDIDTELKTDFTVTSTETQALALKSAQEGAVWSFDADGKFSLTDNNDLSDYISKIKNITGSGDGTLTLPANVDNPVISSLIFTYGIEGSALTSVAVPDSYITSNANGKITYSIPQTVINAFATLVEANKTSTFVFELEGVSNYAISGTASFTAPVTVEAGALS